MVAATQLAEFPDLVSRATEQRAPHVICDYLEKTAGEVNSWYHAGNPTRDPSLAVLVDDPDLRAARLLMTRAAHIVLRNGLHILGLHAPERMERQTRAEFGGVVSKPVRGSGVAEGDA